MSDSEITVSQSSSRSISPSVLETSVPILEPIEHELELLEQELELQQEQEPQQELEPEQEPQELEPEQELKSEQESEQELEQQPEKQPEQQPEQEVKQEPFPEPYTDSEPEPDPKPEPQSRLIITKIVLNNFKSYFGRRTIGPFHKCFSAIIGPNGSGKSNVIDALLFVFGRRASKIRLKRIAELIHTSDNHRTCSQARVDIYFQTIIDMNQDYKIVKDSQFIISRVATRKSQSQYLINNKTVKFTAVKELLLSKNIDLNNNRFLILQGEVESIAMMKPKGNNEEGLLEYLEDIIGSNVYVERIEEAGERVEQMGTEVQEKLNRVKMVERDREKLENAKNEAEKYVKQKMHSWKLQSIQTQFNLNRFENRILSNNHKLENINIKINENNEEQKEIQTEMRDIEDQYQDIRQEKNVLNEELERAQKKFQECEEKDVAAQERCKHLKREMNRMKNQEEKCLLEKTELENTLEYNVNDGIPHLLTTIDELNVNLEQETEEQQRMIAELAENTQPIKDKMISKQRLLLPLKDDENEIKQRLNIIDDEIEDIRSKANAIHLRKQKLEMKLNDIHKQINVSKDNGMRDEQQLQTYERDLHDFEHKIQELQNASSNVPLQRAEMEMREAQQILNRNARVNQSRGGHRILSAIMKAQQNGELSGIYGRLGDLAVIDGKYDIAISTAAGGKLNYIVVEKMRDGTRIIEYLKRCKLGRTSIIVLEKQMHFQHIINKRQPSNNRIPALFDLISFENKRLGVVFYNVLREVLVADNLEIANNVAYGRQRKRVVTLDGKVIERSGTLSGGGSHQSKGGMRLRNASNHNNNNNGRNENPRSKFTAEYVMQLEENVKQMHIQLNEYRKEMNSYQQQMYECKRLVRKERMKQRKLNTEMQGLVQREKSIVEQLVDVNKQLKVFESESKDDEQKIEQLMVDKNEQTEVFVSARRRCELLEDDILMLEKEILDAGGNDIRLQKSKVDQMRMKLDADEKKLVTLRVQSETCEKKLRKINKKLPTFETDLHEMKVEYETNSELMKELEEIAANVMIVLNEKKELFNAKEKEWKKLSKIVEKQQQTLTKLTKIVMNLNDQKKNLELELNSLLSKKKKYHKNIQELYEKYIKYKNEFLDENEEENEEKEEKQNENKNNNDDDDDMDMDVEEEDNDAKIMELDDDDCCPSTISSVSSMRVDRYLNENTLIFGMLSNDQLHELNMPDIDESIGEYKKIIASSKVNMAAIEDYRMKDADYVRRLQDLQSYKEKAAERRQMYELLKTTRFDTFMDGFSQISTKLKEMYRMLTQGGDAELNLVDSIDPFSEGVQFSVRPPKKSWKNISNLSGGEKTLSSMALVFALHIYRPTPLYVMDEIDAALDFKNVSIVASYIQNQTKNAQFIIISLRNNMFDLANRLVGIYKINNATNSITIDPHLFSLSMPMQIGNQNEIVDSDSKILFMQALPDLNISQSGFPISEQVREMPISLMNELDDYKEDESSHEDIDIQVLLDEQQPNRVSL